MKIGKYELHLHSVSVHFTNALFPVAVFFLLLYVLFRRDPFRHTYFHLMVLATVSAPVSYLTGLVEWKKKYKGAMIRIFIRKYQYGLILLATGILCTLWYWFYPGVIEDTSWLGMVFVLLHVSILPLVMYLGYLGGKLVFGGGH